MTDKYFADRRRACALLLHMSTLRAAQGAELKRTGAVSADTGEIYRHGIAEVLREAAAEGRSADLTRSLLALVFEVRPDMAERYETVAAELYSAAYTEVDEAENEAGG